MEKMVDARPRCSAEPLRPFIQHFLPHPSRRSGPPYSGHTKGRLLRVRKLKLDDDAAKVTGCDLKLAKKRGGTREGPRGRRQAGYLDRSSLESGGNTTSRPSSGIALSSMLKPGPSLWGKAAPILVQRLPALPLLSYSSTVKNVEVCGIATGCSNGRIASGRRVGVAPLTCRAGRVHGCTNGPAIGGGPG
jgi:hypothetical protein